MLKTNGSIATSVVDLVGSKDEPRLVFVGWWLQPVAFDIEEVGGEVFARIIGVNNGVLGVDASREVREGIRHESSWNVWIMQIHALVFVLHIKAAVIVENLQTLLDGVAEQAVIGGAQRKGVLHAILEHRLAHC